jgi:hypothetical protein
MYKVVFFVIGLFNVLSLKSQEIGIRIDLSDADAKMRSGTEVLKKMHNTYKNAPCKAYTFSQKNTHYRNDSVIGNSEWHEAIEFPDKFRINFGDTLKGNFVIFKNDSSYNYRNFELKKTSHNTNTLLLLLGGMYYRSFDDVISRLDKEHYNTSVLSHQKIGKEHFYVVGAFRDDSLSNQIWVSKKNLRVVKIIENWDGGDRMDMRFEAYQPNCKGFVETKVSFRRNGKLEQVEEYYNIKIVDSFPKKMFYP